MNRVLIKEQIIIFNFKKVFNELGWNNYSQDFPIELNGKNIILKGTAEKRGFVVLVYESEQIPVYSIRKTIESKVTKLAFEHIIIYIDSKKTTQIWQWVKREQNKPAAVRENTYHVNQNPEILVQKLENISFALEEEDTLGIADVKIRTKIAFDVEKVTKQFYEKFKKEHTSFISFIKGIEKQVDREWYTSLMLNRLMFIYFIQKKGFLDSDTNYLSNKLNEVQKTNGKNKFYSFYRNFLLVLFHKGLGSQERDTDLVKLIGKVPYLNGGLFDVHELEMEYPEIDIPDKAFEGIFNFFNQYEWHLDTSIKATGREINPDVIGYIFEKYINDRASMGAYYTKEDITDYISKNCVIPFLFDETERKYKPFAFAEIFSLLKENPDKYIYPAVKYGVPKPKSDLAKGDIEKEISDDVLFSDLPDEIKIGFNPKLEKKIVDGTGDYLCDLRKAWNKPAPSKIALPTEIYREMIERRKRYKEIHNKALNGEIENINDFITFNLDIKQFALDAIQYTNDPLLLEHLYKAIKNVKILDPTCGSGAFLFAALNILEPMYEACINRMNNFIEDAKVITEKKGKQTLKFKYFEEELEFINSPLHPNIQYFIYKSIILNNLYGVDIMNEAVEIAKLRLFLKLVATVDVDLKKPNLGLEPLPDIDFNIRAGNTLVGFVKEEEAIASLQTGQFDFYAGINERIKETLKILKQKELEFRDLQNENKGGNKIKSKKEEIINTRTVIHELLNLGLAKLYDIDPHNTKRFNEWRVSHQPFHWFFEFPEIMNKDNIGFDVIIGNPPYIEYSKVKSQYTFKGYETESCGNLYANIMECALKIMKENGRVGVIIPLASFSTKRMSNLQSLFSNNSKYLYISNFEATSNPTTLFIGVKIQLSIMFCEKKVKSVANIFTTSYKRCYVAERPYLFENIIFIKSLITNNYITRLNYTPEKNILTKLLKDRTLAYFFGTSSSLYYRNMGNFFYKLAFKEEPIYFKNDVIQSSSTVSVLGINNEEEKNIIIATINSTLFYYYWIIFSDCYHLSKNDIGSFNFDIKNLHRDQKELLIKLTETYTTKIEENAIWQIENKSDGVVKEYRRYFPQSCKPIADSIDKVLAEHYSFTHEELDFIINYDIKYRMGKELEEE